MFRILLLGVVMVIPVWRGAQAGAAEAPAAEGWTYPNGLRVLFIPSPGAPMTACVALVGVGSAAEKERMYGAAHLLEHLLFNGTSTLTQEELYAAFDRIGAYANAATRKDYTMFQVLAPREHEARAAELLAQMLFDSTLPPAAFKKEKGIVLEEIRGGASPAEQVFMVSAAALLADTPYARTSIATEAEVTRIDRADVLAFYERYYTSPNVTLVVMGAGDGTAAREWLAPFFGGESRPGFARAIPRKPTWPVDGAWSTAPSPDGRWRLVARYPAPAPGTPEYAAAVMLAAALDRHVMTLPDLPPLPELAVSLDVGRWFTHLHLSVPFEAADPLETLVAWRRSVRKLAATIPANLDLSPVRTHMAFEDASLRQRPHYYPFFRGPEFLVRPTANMVDAPRAAARVDIEAVRAVAHRVFTGPHAAVVLVPGGEARTVPPPPVEDAAPTVPPGVPDAVAVREIEERWSNGLRLQVRREPGLQVAAVHVLVHGRVGREPAGKSGAAELLHRCLLGGTGSRDERELESALTRMGARVKTHDDARIPYDNYYLSPGYSYLRMEILDEFLPDGLAFLGDVLRHAAYPEDVVAREREQLLRDATVALHGPGTRARRILYKALFGGEAELAQSALGRPGDIRSLRADDLRDLHPQYFAPQALTVSVVTGSDPVRVRNLARAIFGGAPAAEPDTTGAAAPEAALPPPTQGRHIDEVSGGGQAYLVLGQVLRVAEDDRAAAMVASAHLNERIAQVLREERGWAYSVGCGIDWGGPAPVWLASFAGSAEHLAAAEREIRDAVQRVRTVALTTQDVERTANQLRGRQQMRRLSAINRAFFWAMSARRAELARPGLAADVLGVDLVTPQRVRAVAQRMWEPDAWVVVRLRPMD